MFIRRVAKTVATTAAVGAISAIGVLALSGAAGADLTPGQQIQAALPQSPFTAGLPFASGQVIEVKVPPNTLLPRTAAMHILECAAGPGGAPPTGTFNCDNNTIYPNTVTPSSSDGSIDITDFNVYAPPSPFLGENASNALKCGGSTNPCILYIGQDQTVPSLPHVWSQAFQVKITGAEDGVNTVNPGDGTPEVPLAIGLPLAAAGIVGGTVLFRRRKAARAAA
jgi:hypothetical protein